MNRRRRAATVGLVLGLLSPASSLAFAGWTRAVPAQHASAKYGAWCTQPGTQTVTGSPPSSGNPPNIGADTYISQNDNGVPNGGTAITMQVGGTAANQVQRALVTLPLPAKPSGCSVTLATLRLVKSGSCGASPRTFQVYPVTSSWGEATVIWSGPSVGTLVVAQPCSGSGSTPAQTYTVTSAVVSGYASTGQSGGVWNGFEVRDATEGVVQSSFVTRENGTAANRPQLQITFG